MATKKITRKQIKEEIKQYKNKLEGINRQLKESSDNLEQHRFELESQLKNLNLFKQIIVSATKEGVDFKQIKRRQEVLDHINNQINEHLEVLKHIVARHQKLENFKGLTKQEVSAVAIEDNQKEKLLALISAIKANNKTTIDKSAAEILKLMKPAEVNAVLVNLGQDPKVDVDIATATKAQQAIFSTQYRRQENKRWQETVGLIAVGLLALPILPVVLGVIAYLWTKGKNKEPIQKVDGKFMTKKDIKSHDVLLGHQRRREVEDVNWRQEMVKRGAFDRDKGENPTFDRPSPVPPAGRYVTTSNAKQTDNAPTSQLKERPKSAQL